MHKIDLIKGEYLSTKKSDILKFLDDNHKILVDSNPGSGKTYFFVELAEEIITGKRRGRLIFCSPFLMIQSQFETSLKLKGHVVDLKLNHLSKRKKLNSEDKIVTSTYQSLKHISADLTEDDIVVIDEAHMLAVSYGYKPNEKSYYSKEILALLRTKAKIVLLSGTPNKEISLLLNAKTLKIISGNDIDAEIILRQSSHSPTKIAEVFATKLKSDYKSGFLHVIFIKNRKQCELIKDSLKLLGFKTAILTSDYKKSDTYEKLVEQMTVEEDVDFLICTSLISTGANIKNKNIGEALMLNETSPTEIKQFSKRFRNKLDITVNVVNNGLTSRLIKGSESYDKAIEKQVATVKSLLDERERITDSSIPNDYSDSYDNSELGTKDQFEEILVDRTTKQISYLNDLRSEKCIDSSILLTELNQFNDIKVTNKVPATSILKSTVSLESGKKAEYEDEVSSIRQRFTENPLGYEEALINNENQDYYLHRRLVETLKFNGQSASMNKQAYKDMEHPYFEREVINPILEFYPYIPNTSYILNLHEQLNTRQINKLEITLFTVIFRETHIDFGTSKDDYKPFIKSYKILSAHQQLFAKIILEIYRHCLGRKAIGWDGLTTHIETIFGKKLKSLKKADFPLNKIHSNGGIKSETFRAILDGLIYSKELLNKKTFPITGETKSLIFESGIPKKLPLTDARYINLYNKVVKSKALLYDANDNAVKLAFGAITSRHIVIPNRELVIYKPLINVFNAKSP